MCNKLVQDRLGFLRNCSKPVLPGTGLCKQHTPDKEEQALNAAAKEQAREREREKIAQEIRGFAEDGPADRHEDCWSSYNRLVHLALALLGEKPEDYHPHWAGK